MPNDGEDVAGMVTLTRARVFGVFAGLVLFILLLSSSGLYDSSYLPQVNQGCLCPEPLVKNSEPQAFHHSLVSPATPQINPQSNIALVSWVFGDNYQRPGNISGLSKILYCAKFNYSCYDIRTLPSAQKRDNFDTPHYDPNNVESCVWAKIQWMHQILGDHEWLWWSDADTVIRDYKHKLEPVIEEACRGRQFCDMIASKDWNGFNAGSFLLRRSAWSFQMLEHVLRKYTGPKKVFNEQSYMIEYLEAEGDPNKRRVTFVNQTIINAYNGQAITSPVSLLLHFPATYMQHGRHATNKDVEGQMENVVRDKSRELELETNPQYYNLFQEYRLEKLYPVAKPPRTP